jgi:hypothetical protein
LTEALERPVCISELTRDIAALDATLARAIANKSLDYVRVTISTAPRRQFVKYKYIAAGLDIAIPDHNPRKAYWGVLGENYSESWKAASVKRRPGSDSSVTPLMGMPELPTDGRALASLHPTDEPPSVQRWECPERPARHADPDGPWPDVHQLLWSDGDWWGDLV